MEYLGEEEIARIEEEPSSKIIEIYGLNTECLLYDVTNFTPLFRNMRVTNYQRRAITRLNASI